MFNLLTIILDKFKLFILVLYISIDINSPIKYFRSSFYLFRKQLWLIRIFYSIVNNIICKLTIKHHRESLWKSKMSFYQLTFSQILLNYPKHLWSDKICWEKSYSFIFLYFIWSFSLNLSKNNSILWKDILFFLIHL